MTTDGTVAETTLGAEQQTPTTEEQMKALQDQLAESHKKQVEYEQKIRTHEESYKGLQRTLNQRNQELQKQADLRAEMESVKETQKLLIAEIANRGVVEENPEDMPQGRKQDLLKQYEAIEKQRAEKVKAEAIKRQQEEYVAQADTIWQKAKALGLPEDDDNLLDIEDYLKTGNLRRAEAKIKKLEQTKQTPNQPKETEEERIKKAAEAMYQQRLKEEGLLQTETAVPSGRTLAANDIIARYAMGDKSISHKQYREAVASQG